jgi:hypothetical protein
MMWRIFESAIVRKIAYVLVALAASLLFGHRAHATNAWVGGGGSGCVLTGDWANAAGYFQACLATRTVSPTQWTTLGVECNTPVAAPTPCTTPCVDPPTASGQHCYVEMQAWANVSGTIGPSGSTQAEVSSVVPCSGVGTGAGQCGAAPLSCSGLPNQDIMAAISASSFNSGGLICVNGCGYTNSASSMHITTGTQGNAIIGQAVATGQGCASGTSTVTAALATSNCLESGGTTVCHQANGNVATVNNDILNPAAPPPPGQCAAYADGAVECNRGSGGTLSVIAGPTTGGTLNTPVAKVTTTTDELDYFSPAQVTASATPVGGVNSGNMSGNPAGNTMAAAGPCTPTAPGVIPVITCTGTSVNPPSTGGGAGTPSAPNGDCGATGINCTSDGTLPSLSRSDTIQSNVQTYWNAVAAAPIVAAFGSISGSWPTATCPTETFSIAMFHGSPTFDAMAPVCTVWGGTVAPTLSLVFLALWAVQGIRVILSA